jgi:hypothetical protein
MLKCANLIETQFDAYLYASSFFVLGHIIFETKIFASCTNSTLLRIYFRNLSVQRSFLQYKNQCLEKVNVKYVIKRLWHEISHIVPGINPRPMYCLSFYWWFLTFPHCIVCPSIYGFWLFHISPGISTRITYQARQRRWRAGMGRGLIPGTIWEISCHNLCLVYFLNQTRNKNICKLNKGNSFKELISQFVSSKIFFGIIWMEIPIPVSSYLSFIPICWNELIWLKYDFMHIFMHHLSLYFEI